MSHYDIEQGGASCPIFRKKGTRAVVLCNGPPPPAPLLEYWLNGADLFVCADAAGHPYDHLPRTPDVVIGDFDSLAGRILDGRSGPKFLQVADQFTTDSEKALLYLVEQGVAEAVLMGATGWRLDHTLFNVHLLERFADRLRICIAGHHADTVRLGAGAEVSWDLPRGTLFSLIPMCGEVTAVTLEGARYPLLGETLAPGGFATISNRVDVSPLLVTIGEGSVLVAVDRETGPPFVEDIFTDDTPPPE
jgi:thiamine pyrophosphokinase